MKRPHLQDFLLSTRRIFVLCECPKPERSERQLRAFPSIQRLINLHKFPVSGLSTSQLARMRQSAELHGNLLAEGHLGLGCLAQMGASRQVMATCQTYSASQHVHTPKVVKKFQGGD
eukprot:834280-Amphidinium_carterae.2